MNPPDPSKVTAVLRSVAAQAKIEEPLEVSAPIQANPTSSIPWIMCLRSGATEESKHHTYAAFFKNNDYVSSRWSVIIDHCETQNFAPLRTENLIRVDAVMESPKLAEYRAALFRSVRPGLAIQVEVAA